MKVLYRRRGFTVVELLVVLVIIGILAAILFPLFARRPSHGGPSCLSNLKQIGLGILQYTQDYDEKLPRVNAFPVSSPVAPTQEPYGWADAIQPYTKSTQLLQCPQEEHRDVEIGSIQSGYTDYYFNTNASGVALKFFAQSVTTLLCGDGNDGSDVADARYNRNSLPDSWRADSNSPARRHHDTAYYLFADGHAKWIKPNAIQNTASPSRGRPTFAIR